MLVRWSDFDQENGRIHVTKSRKRGAQEYEGAPKTQRGIRIVTLTDAAMKNLLTWKKVLAEKLLSMGIRLSDDDYIFRALNDVTIPMPLITLTQLFWKLKKQSSTSPQTSASIRSGTRTRHFSPSRKSARRRFRCASVTPPPPSRWTDMCITRIRCRMGSRR